MSFTLQELSIESQAAIENLTTLLEIGTGSDIQDEIIAEAVQAISWIMDEASITR